MRLLSRLFPLTSRLVGMLGHPAIRGGEGHGAGRGGLASGLVAGTGLWPALCLDMLIAAPVMALALMARWLYRAIS